MATPWPNHRRPSAADDIQQFRSDQLVSTWPHHEYYRKHLQEKRD
jgi:hypothetical protein